MRERERDRERERKRERETSCVYWAVLPLLCRVNRFWLLTSFLIFFLFSFFFFFFLLLREVNQLRTSIREESLLEREIEKKMNWEKWYFFKFAFKVCVMPLQLISSSLSCTLNSTISKNNVLSNLCEWNLLNYQKWFQNKNKNCKQNERTSPSYKFAGCTLAKRSNIKRNDNTIKNGLVISNNKFWENSWLSAKTAFAEISSGQWRAVAPFNNFPANDVTAGKSGTASDRFAGFSWK